MNLAPALPLLLLAALLALPLLGWVILRRPGQAGGSRLAALTTLVAFLTFDLIVFGAFTRLSDSGLGCPDWPGCYGHASPIGAREPIAAAQAALPSGPVTPHKAWIEMIHRYLAMTVGALILVLAVASWSSRRKLRVSPWWPTLTLLWVIVQGLFGKYTVTLKLYPAVVTLHLLGGLLLLSLLMVQREAWSARRVDMPALAPGLTRWAWIALALLVVQITLGGWVSTNYAVLACSGFPACSGQWWPAMDASGFAVLRDLGHDARGRLLPFEALVAIHWAHRSFAWIATLAAALLAGGLIRQPHPWARRFGRGLALLLALQWASGLSNVVLDWPLVAALLHTAGAAAMVALLTSLLARAARRRPWPAAVEARAAALA